MSLAPGISPHGWTQTVRVLPVPVLLTLAHLIGGGSGQLEAGLLTMVIALIGAEAFARGRLGLDRAYRRDLRVPVVALLFLLALALTSVTPGSDRLASGWIAGRAGLPTLSVDPEATWIEIVKLLGLTVMFVTAYRYASTQDRLVRTLTVLVWLTVGWAAWALILYATSARTVDGIARLSGTFVSPNVAACVLSVGLLCWMYLLDRRITYVRGNGRSAVLAWAASGLVLTGTLLLTASRSAIIIMAVLATVWFTARVLGRMVPDIVSRGRLFVGLALLATVAVLAYSASGFLERIDALGGEADNRGAIIANYVEAALANPAFGHGLGTVPRISRLLLTPENDAIMWNIRAVHNLPLQWWIETGLIGLVPALLGGGWLLSATALRLEPAARLPLLPLFMVSAFMLLQGLVDYPVQIYSVALTWAFVLGLAYRAATSWAAPGGSAGGRHREMRPGVSPRRKKTRTERPLGREVPGKRSG